MLESSPACPGPNYSHIVHSSEGNTSLASQLNYITDIILELKAELAKIKTELKEFKNQLTVVHLSRINKVQLVNLEELNKIMSVISDKYDVFSYENCWI